MTNLIEDKFNMISASTVLEKPVHVQELNTKVEDLSNQIEVLKKSIPTSGGFKGEVAAMKKEVQTVLDSAKMAANNMDTTMVKERMEAAWSEVVSRKRPGVLPMKTILREQLEQAKLTEDNKRNLMP